MSERERAEIKRVISSIFEAARNKDFEKLEELNSWDEGYTKFSDLPPFERLEGDSARHFDIVLFTNITDFSCLIEDLKIQTYGDCAVATCYLNYGGIFVNDYNFEAKRFTQRSRATFVLVKKRGKWVVVHEHLSQFVQN
ncbi:hypothetical protein B9Q11_00450 [Candidatus Marsarchaeota G2 archaeon ECH_B_SAG-F08]|jgi:ketosteroid isomerase-like protein|uniref:SnoaL-like domain-containing protein n=5 Tax=Candidatus Marsarchaeota TaxID=1978152 RepID=A0A2R6AEK3_9ARCH|nr:MAG: hypothetical protein B9Q01_09070 [Candidatus Marsarchaeota G1 archaeon OSP_D]PSN84817.1 MAG: hypothetical protein B9Q02_08645 [Candidatus Marsarchaeota G1 archaeon BE_D]PSN87578.1 MAG: hypothetical protein B9P99_06400 [Candidatus Marsarchaeota G1 archaeon OSP_B]PSN99896.1 MAG: hypothetical protein B9Q11_00450 [Candidatus Marsarchaeota G2 archaeon ECH_B_SAG-F08]PSO04455.1 MAG: hypothetical protein B9Q13_04540 [Candidatus Marsarchaeota G2 archaeon ECH_B_SAG-G16]